MLVELETGKLYGVGTYDSTTTKLICLKTVIFLNHLVQANQDQPLHFSSDFQVWGDHTGGKDYT